MSVLTQVTERMEAITPGRFPIDVFPEPLRFYINEMRDRGGFVPEYTAGGILFATSVAIGNALRVQPRNNWREPSMLWCLLVGRPGAGKTHPLNAAIAPIVEADMNSAAGYHKELARHEMEMEEYYKTKGKANAPDHPGAPPAYRKRLVRDFTIESYFEIHESTEKGVSIISDEIVTVLRNAGRYNKSSGEKSLMNSVWSGVPISVDRRGRHIDIPLPHTSMAGTIQPGVISTLAGDGGAYDGTVDRFLFFYPDQVERGPWSEDQVNPAALDKYHSIISRINQLEVERDPSSGFAKPSPVVLSKPAKEMWADIYMANSEAINASHLESEQSMLSKMDSQCLRLALSLNTLSWATGELENNLTISEQAMEGASRLCEYFKSTATKVHGLLSQTDPSAFLTEQQKQFLAEVGEYFTTAEALAVGEKIQAKRRTVEDWLDPSSRVPVQRISQGKYKKSALR